MSEHAAAERPVPRLVGDVGGTNARFALADATGALHGVQTLSTHDHASLEAAVNAYLAQAAPDARPHDAVIAVAGPVVDGAIRLTNLQWATSEAAMAQATGIGRVRLCNDYAALAHAAPRLQPEDLHHLGGPASPPRATVAVLGPGTGFGVAALVREGALEAAAIGEGGHVAFAPGDAEEAEILRLLTRRFGRVSVERILSGPGLHNLHDAICEMAGQAHDCTSAAEVTRLADAGDALAIKAVERFCAILGAVAGDFALAYGARGGVQIAGGISPRILPALQAGAFRARFEAKGRFEGYMQGVATHVILHPYAALVGAVALLAPTDPDPNAQSRAGG